MIKKGTHVNYKIVKSVDKMFLGGAKKPAQMIQKLNGILSLPPGTSRDECIIIKISIIIDSYVYFKHKSKPTIKFINLR